MTDAPDAGIPPGVAPHVAPHLEDLRAAARAAVAGGRAACAHYGAGDLEVEQKGEDDPVTAADHASNDAILRVLRSERPLDPILSEESPVPGTGRAGGRLWVVDPLDGTKEFIAENGEFSIMVGLALRGRAVLGAVHQPAADRLYLGVTDAWAGVVAGAQQDDPVPERSARRLRLAGAASGGGPLRLVRSRSHPDERLRALVEALGEVDEILSGSVGIKCALVATGEADLYVHPVPYLKEWDTCAPEAVLRGAGGRVTDCAGGTLRYGDADPRQRGGIFAARPDVWDRVEPIVREIARPMFQGAGADHSR